MSEKAADNAMQMPSADALVQMAIARMDRVGIQAVEIDQRTLADLCLRLVDPAMNDTDAWRWLNTEMGGSDVEQVVDDHVVRRFKRRFMPVYRQVLGEEVRRISRLAVREFATETDQLNRGLLGERVAELLLDPARQHKPGDLLKMSMIVRDAEQAVSDRDKLALATKQAEDRAAKLEADVERMEREQQRKDRQIGERLKALRSRIDELSSRAEKGQRIDPSLFASIREELIALAAPGKEAA